MADVFDQFLTMIQPCLETWRSIGLRVLATKDPRIGWRCEAARAVLSHSDSPHERGDLPKHPTIVAAQEIWPIGRLPDLVGMLRTGELILGHETIMVKQFNGSAWLPLSSFWFRTYDRVESRAHFELDWKTVVLNGWDSSGRLSDWQRDREILDGQLRDLNPPWDGVSDLRRNFIGQTSEDAQRNDLNSFELIAPILLRFGARTTLRSRRLTLHVETEPTVDRKVAAASIFGSRGGETISRRRIGLGASLKRASYGGFSTSVMLNSRHTGARCTLSYHGLDSDELYLYGTSAKGWNVSWAVLTQVVGGVEGLTKALREDSGDPFEHAVAMLFHLLGFSVIHFGPNTFSVDSGMADLVAIPQGRSWLLIIECKSRDLNPSESIAKLATRSRELQSALRQSKIVPVYVVRQPRTGLVDLAMRDAASEQMSIIALDELNQLVEVAAGGSGVDKVRDFLQQFVPSGTGPWGR